MAAIGAASLVGLADVEFAARQRFTFIRAIATCAVMALAAMLFGVIPLRA